MFPSKGFLIMMPRTFAFHSIRRSFLLVLHPCNPVRKNGITVFKIRRLLWVLHLPQNHILFISEKISGGSSGPPVFAGGEIPNLDRQRTWETCHNLLDIILFQDWHIFLSCYTIFLELLLKKEIMIQILLFIASHFVRSLIYIGYICQTSWRIQVLHIFCRNQFYFLSFLVILKGEKSDYRSV